MKTKQKQKQNNLNKQKLLYIGIFLLSAFFLLSPLFFKVDIGNLKHLGILGVALFNFAASSTLFFPAPGILATGIGGSLYNPILVALAASIGSTIGESVGFAFGHSSRKLGSGKHKMIDNLLSKYLHKYGGLVIFLLAFIPNPFFDAVGILAGLTLYPLKKFILFVFLGRLTRDLIVAYVGSTIA